MKDLFTITPLTDTMRAALEGSFDIHHVDDMGDPAVWLETHGKGIEYALTDGHYGVQRDYLDALPDLKLISSNGVGYDGIDTGAAVARNILVTHTPDVLNAEVATTALMLMLACYRELLPNEAHARSGAWATEGNLPLSRSADNRTVGILGLGRIGMAIAEKLAPFNPTILYNTRTEKDVPFTFVADLTEMARRSDVLICIVPGGAATQHIVNAGVIKALGPEGILINVARGSVVDEAALTEALSSGALAAAGLDVFEDEPNIPDALKTMPNVVLTPHVGSATVETRAAMGQLAVDNLLQHLKDGSVLTPVPECKGLL